MPFKPTSTNPWINLITKTMIRLYFIVNAKITKHDPLMNMDPPKILNENENQTLNDEQ